MEKLETRPGARGLAWGIGLSLAWLASWAWILSREEILLPHAPREPLAFLAGELVVGATILLLVWMSRRIRPAPCASAPARFRAPRTEAIGLLAYMVALVWTGDAIGVRPHIASLGLTDQTLPVWRTQTADSVLLWAGYYFLFGAAAPFIFFRFALGYSSASMLLRWPRPAGRWIPYAIATGAAGVLGFAGTQYWSTSLPAHLATVVIFAGGTFLPVMVLTQCILAPRLAAASGSLVAGAVLAGLAYGLYHITEFYLSWHSAEAALTSLSWLVQFATFGFFKGITTLRTGSAWLHIFNSHLPHLAEAPQIAACFGLRE